MLRAERRHTISEVNYSLERVEEGSDSHRIYIKARAEARKDIEELDALLTMLGFEPKET
jgi:hypothetical protein